MGRRRQLLPTLSQEDGFTVIEVLVAFTLLALVTIGTVPLFVSGLKGSLIAKMDTGAKNLSQQRIEQMRNLPFHVEVVSPSPPEACVYPPYTKGDAAATSCDYRDMLDTYFRSADADPASPGGPAGALASSKVTPGYVNSNSLRDPDEPPVPFYRFVFSPVEGFPRYSQYIATQFLDVNLNPLTPPTAYNTQVSGSDSPPSRLVGVTVITRWEAGGVERKFVTFTQIADARPAQSSVILQSRASALRINTATSNGQILSMEAGVSSSDGGVSNGGFASTKALSGFAELVGQGTLAAARVEGKTQSSSAPPNQTVFSSTDVNDENTLLHPLDGSVLAFFHRTKVEGVDADIVSEQPQVGGPTGYSRGRIRKGNSAGDNNLRFTNVRTSETSPLLFLDLPKFLLRIDEPGGGAYESIHTAQGGTYLTATGGGSHNAESGAQTVLKTVKLFPNTILGATDGIIKISIKDARLKCFADRNGASASVFGATPSDPPDIEVQYFSNTGYVTADIQALPDPATTSVAGGVRLIDYISSWTGQLTPTSTISGSKVSASVDLLSISTKPTRTDPNSTMDLRFGSMACHAEDTRG